MKIYIHRLQVLCRRELIGTKRNKDTVYNQIFCDTPGEKTVSYMTGYTNNVFNEVISYSDIIEYEDNSKTNFNYDYEGETETSCYTSISNYIGIRTYKKMKEKIREQRNNIKRFHHFMYKLIRNRKATISDSSKKIGDNEICFFRADDDYVSFIINNCRDNNFAQYMISIKKDEYSDKTGNTTFRGIEFEINYISRWKLAKEDSYIKISEPERKRILYWIDDIINNKIKLRRYKI
jgi:hypothetical protein